MTSSHMARIVSVTKRDNGDFAVVCDMGQDGHLSFEASAERLHSGEGGLLNCELPPEARSKSNVAGTLEFLNALRPSDTARGEFISVSRGDDGTVTGFGIYPKPVRSPGQADARAVFSAEVVSITEDPGEFEIKYKDRTDTGGLSWMFCIQAHEIDDLTRSTLMGMMSTAGGLSIRVEVDGSNKVMRADIHSVCVLNRPSP